MTLSPILPPPLAPGARVGVAALSGAVEEDSLVRGLSVLEAAGLDVVTAPNVDRREGLFAGTDEERVMGLHQLAADPEIEAILFARGGHGVLRLLANVDWELLAGRPRWYVGFSDLTPFLAQVVKRLGWVALHGPMVAAQSGIEADEIANLLEVMEGRWPYQLQLAGTDGDWTGVEGRLAGGCLTMLASTLGTEWTAPTAASILFLEDRHEPLYRVDRMLQQLRLSGALDSVRGVVLGSFEAAGSTLETREVLAAVRDAAGNRLPVAWGCPSGHCRPNSAVALGATARVDQDAARLILGVG